VLLLRCLSLVCVLSCQVCGCVVCVLFPLFCPNYIFVLVFSLPVFGMRFVILVQEFYDFSVSVIIII
jgi:hypothetical protein